MEPTRNRRSANCRQSRRSFPTRVRSQRSKLRPLIRRLEQLCESVRKGWLWCREWLLAGLEAWSRVQSCGQQTTVDQLMASVETCDWLTASIRCIARHPNRADCALLTHRDEVLLYTDLRAAPKQLLATRQRQISCAAFRPWSRTELAVGAAGGICLWKPARLKTRLLCMLWLGCDKLKQDFIVDLQWLHEGSYLASATLGTRCIQIWQPERAELLQQLESEQPGCHCWALRYPKGLVALIARLRSDLWLLQNPNSLPIWAQQLTQGLPLQTAAWTARGKHLLYVAKDSSQVWGVTSTRVDRYLKHSDRHWSSVEIIDLRCFDCEWALHEGGPVQAMAIDPRGIYVAFTFRRRPFVLLCLLHKPFDCRLKLKPLQLIRCQDIQPQSYPTCLNFAFTNFSADSLNRSLIVAWSTGHLQVVQIIAQSREHALRLEQLQIRHVQQVIEINLS